MKPRRPENLSQIARRSAQLALPIPSPWKDILLDSFEDLVTSKIVALVEWGTPRDFLDIYRLNKEDLVAPLQCWQLWRRRQELMSSDANEDRARLAILTHLTRIEQQRPLDMIVDESARTGANNWPISATTPGWPIFEKKNAFTPGSSGWLPTKHLCMVNSFKG